MRQLAKPEVLLALGIIALGLVALDQTWRIPVSPLYAKVGPTAMAYAASVLLIGLGLASLAQAWLGRWQTDTDAHTDAPPSEPMQWRSVGWLLAGLVLNVGLIAPLGFVPASTLLFACTARAFGSFRPIRDLLIGAVFAAIAYFGFAKLLDINIGAGLLEGML